MPDDETNSILPEHRKITHSRIEIFDLGDGGKKFVVPALRNFKIKRDFTVLMLIFGAALAIFLFVTGGIVRELPFAWARFIAINFFFYFFAVLSVAFGLFAFLCLDTWLRSTRIMATAGELRIATHRLFLRQTNVIPVSKIIGIKAANNLTSDDNGTVTYYYDIEVITEDDGKGWLAALRSAAKKLAGANNSFTENDLKALNAGGRKIRAITDIEGQAEADWILEQLRSALGIRA